MKLATYIGGDIVTYTSRLADGTVVIESSALGDDNVRSLYAMYQERTMQSKVSL